VGVAPSCTLVFRTKAHVCQGGPGHLNYYESDNVGDDLCSRTLAMICVPGNTSARGGVDVNSKLVLLLKLHPEVALQRDTYAQQGKTPFQKIQSTYATGQ
jgi:hypothetical protein